MAYCFNLISLHCFFFISACVITFFKMLCEEVLLDFTHLIHPFRADLTSKGVDPLIFAVRDAHWDVLDI